MSSSLTKKAQADHKNKFDKISASQTKMFAIKT